jgi:Tfp pilus assembly PilM family ATPase
MAEKSIKPFLSVAIHPEYLAFISVRDAVVQELGWRPFNPPLNAETLQNEPLFVEKVGNTFSSLSEAVVQKGTDIAIAVNGSMVIQKKIPVALGLGEELIQSHMAWEAEQYLLSPLDNYVVTHQRLPFSTPSGNPLFLQVLIRKQIVRMLRGFAKNIGLSLKDIDVDLFTNVRAILANYDFNSKGSLVLVDVQLDHLVFVFIHQQEFFLSHRVGLQTESRIKSADPAEINKILMKELKRLVFGHRLGKGIEDLEALLLTGQAVIHDMLNELKGMLPTEILDPFRRISVGSTLSESEAFSRSPDKFAASVGLALKRVPTLKTNP